MDWFFLGLCLKNLEVGASTQGDPSLEHGADDDNMSGDELNLDDVESDHDYDDTCPDSPLHASPVHADMPDHLEPLDDSQPMSPMMMDAIQDGDSDPECAIEPSQPTSPKGIEPDDLDKCVVIDDSPEKDGTSPSSSVELSQDEVQGKIRQLQQALLNAKKMQMAQNFGFGDSMVLPNCSVFVWPQ